MVNNFHVCHGAQSEGMGVALLLPDLSAAYDTVDHAILLTILEEVFGVKGQCLQ